MNETHDRLIIEGLAGEKALSGEITVHGAKNAALKALAATLLFEGPVSLRRLPDIEDMRRGLELLEKLGARVEQKGGGYAIDTKEVKGGVLDPTIARRMRGSIVFSGPLLARTGRISFPHPGGCVIGARPIDLFLEGFRRMGAEVHEDADGYEIVAPKGLSGAEFFCKNQSVTVTETFMMAGVLAKGITVIKNAALEPEIVHLAEFLHACGAAIEGVGTPTITIEGTGLLHAEGNEYSAPPDRIEAGSFLILGALAARDMTITGCEPAHLEALIHILKDAGVPLHVGRDTIAISGNTKPNSAFTAADIKTHEYPGFPTDLQAPMVVFLTQASGEAKVFETIFEGRLAYTEELAHMGADITMMDPHRILVRGPRALSGRNLESPDLRAGLAFIIAAAVARGRSAIGNVYNIDRGYERIEDGLSALGLSIVRE